MAGGLDATTFATHAAGLHQRLTRLCLAMSGDPGLAEECAQEALVRAWERVDRGEALDSLAAWTTTVALNQCRSRLRRRSTEQRSLRRMWERDRIDASDEADGGEIGPVGADGSTTGREGELSADVRAAVLALPRRQREVVVLRYLLDEDTPTIAAICGISEGAVRNALFHARSALALRLAAHAEGGARPIPSQALKQTGTPAAPFPPQDHVDRRRIDG